MSVPTTSDIFALVLGGIIRWFPELRVDPLVVWRVQDALAAATFTEWERFTKNDIQDTFYSASRYSDKSGACDAQYARVSERTSRSKLDLC